MTSTLRGIEPDGNLSPEDLGAAPASGQKTSPRIGILVVAYNAESTLASVLDRVPASFRPRISEIFVCDDASVDSTYLVGLGYKQQSNDLPLTIVRHAKNLGYGGNQKAGYQMAIDQDLDIIVMLHGDGQYAPECLPEIIAPLERGDADAVMGSRMMEPGNARKGGMPLYKYVGNRVLTAFENKVLGTELTEFHSGYRAYSVDALKSIPFDRNADGFNFDTQIIIQLVDAGKRIVEVPIPTFYGDEICYVNGMKYAGDVSKDVVRYRLEKLGFGAAQYGDAKEMASLREIDAAQATILRWLERRPQAKVLVLGGGEGSMPDRAGALGHDVTAVPAPGTPDFKTDVKGFIDADIDGGLTPEVLKQGPFDVVVCNDILEHVRNPEEILRQIRGLLVPGGVLMTSVPNFGHWYPRLRTAVGLFDYDQRGVLRNAHVRFFTRRGFFHRLHDAGFKVVHTRTTGLPLDVVARGEGVFARTLKVLDRILVNLRPTLFGYQFVCICAPAEPHTRPKA